MAKTNRRLIGTIAYPSGGGPANPLEIKVTNAMKFLVLRVYGKVDITTQATSINPYGPADLLRSVQLKVNGQAGPINADGRTLFFANIKDGVAPKNTVPSAVTVADDYTFDTYLFLDFSMPRFLGGDATLFMPKLANLYTLDLSFGTISDLVTGGAAHFGTDPKVEVYAYEVRGIAPKPNRYHSHDLIKTDLAVSSAQSIKIPFGDLLNELHLFVKTAAGAYSDAVIDNVILRNGNDEIFCDLPSGALKAIFDGKSPMISPSSSPAGYYCLDLSPENIPDDLLDTRGMKELELVLNVAAAGTITILKRAVRDGLD